MAERYAVGNGNWSALATWNGGASLPGASDDVHANNFTVTIDQDVTVLSLQTKAGATAVAGGGFSVSTARTITATGAGIVSGTTTCLTSSATSGTTVTVNAAVKGGESGTNSRGILNNSTGALVVVGNVTGGPGTASGIAGISNTTTGTVSVTGNVAAGAGSSTSAYGINNASTGGVTVVGNVTGGGSAYGINLSGASALNVTGNVTGGSGINLYGINGGTAPITVTGNIVGGSHAQAPGVAISTGTVTLNGDLVPASGNAIKFLAAGKLILNGNIQAVSTGVAPFGGFGELVVIKSGDLLTHTYRTDNGGSIGPARSLSTNPGGSIPLNPVGTLASATNKTTQTTLSTTSTITAAAGQLIVLLVATDNENTTDGETSLHTAATIGGAGMSKAGEYTNTVGGAANDGVTVSVWYLIAPAQIASGAAVVSTLNTGKDAKALQSYIFDLDSLYSVVVDGSATLSNDAADPGSLSATGTRAAPHLWIRAIGLETDNGTAGTLTPTSGWTTLGGTGTTGGAAATNVSVRGEFKIASGTASGASDPTVAAADCASLLVGLALDIPGGGSGGGGSGGGGSSFGLGF